MKRARPITAMRLSVPPTTYSRPVPPPLPILTAMGCLMSGKLMRMANPNKPSKTKMGILKLILLSAFVSVAYQDLKDRSVYWFLFPAIGICAEFSFFRKPQRRCFLEDHPTQLGVYWSVVGRDFFVCNL